MTVRLDSPGIEAVLKSDAMAEQVRAVAEQIAERARAARPDDPFEVRSRIAPDRAVSSVTLTHAKGLAVQAKHGTLTRAAAAAGYEVRGK